MEQNRSWHICCALIVKKSQKKFSNTLVISWIEWYIKTERRKDRGGARPFQGEIPQRIKRMCMFNILVLWQNCKRRDCGLPTFFWKWGLLWRLRPVKPVLLPEYGRLWVFLQLRHRLQKVIGCPRTAAKRSLGSLFSMLKCKYSRRVLTLRDISRKTSTEQWTE